MRWIALFPVTVAACGFSGANPGGDGPIDPVVDGAQVDGQRAIDAPEPVIDARRPPDARPDADPPDASPPDAFVFTPALCPAAYNQTSATSPGSRYRVITSSANFATQHADCNNDLENGWTHLVTFGSTQESVDVANFLGGTWFYIGAVQAPNATTLAGSWRWFDGTSVPTNAWADGQPDDEGGLENGDESLAVAQSSDGELEDVRGFSSYAAVCECDGVPIDPTAASWIP